MKKIFKLMAVLAVVGGVASCDKIIGITGPSDFSGGCEAVDLGVSVKWASYNVGAAAPEGYGSYFAWGETAEKENYDCAKEGDYKWGILDEDPESKDRRRGMTKYTGDVERGDGLKTLQPEDDPATMNWGTKWRTPTKEEWEELLDESKFEWIWDSERKGIIVKNLKTGNSIFLPAAGRRLLSDFSNAGTQGDYWSSTVSEYPHLAYGFCIYQSSRGHKCQDAFRCHGLSVRAVTEY